MKIKTLLFTIVAVLMATPPLASAKDRPIWAQDRTVNAASPLCAYNKGVFRIRPNPQGNYWLVCNDTTMIRVEIRVERNAVAVAKL